MRRDLARSNPAWVSFCKRQLNYLTLKPTNNTCDNWPAKAPPLASTTSLGPSTTDIYNATTKRNLLRPWHLFHKTPAFICCPPLASCVIFTIRQTHVFLAACAFSAKYSHSFFSFPEVQSKAARHCHSTHLASFHAPLKPHAAFMTCEDHHQLIPRVVLLEI